MQTPQAGVYCLIDPRDLSVKYVGQSIDLKKRKSQWRCDFNRCTGYNEDLIKWFDDLGKDNCEPTFTILCQCRPEHLNFMEVFWYQKMSENHKLLQDSCLVGKAARSLHVNDNDALRRLERLPREAFVYRHKRTS